MPDNFKARIVKLEETYDKAFELSQQINASGLEFDIVVGIARGGLPPARFLCDFLGIKRLTTIQIRHYTGGGQQKETAEMVDEPTQDLKGKNVLLIDDVNDTGKTLKAAADFILKQNPKMLKTAVLDEKDTTDFEADLKAERLNEWKWLIYQWAASEDVLEFLKKGDMLDKEPRLIKKYLLDEYSLEIEDELLDKILTVKNNYYGKEDK